MEQNNMIDLVRELRLMHADSLKDANAREHLFEPLNHTTFAVAYKVVLNLIAEKYLSEEERNILNAKID